jgi:pyridoxal phosphate enzyme (YggS family)
LATTTCLFVDVMPSDLNANLAMVRARLERAAERSGRDPASIRLLAVTKQVSADRIRALVALGVRTVGENRVQEALRKQAELADLDLDWHLIGHLQTNKVKQVVGAFDLIHGVDSVKLARELDARAEAILAGSARQDVLLQVNVGREASKSGFFPDDLPAAAAEILGCQHLNVRGLMTVAPYAADPESVRGVFRQLRELRDACQRRAGDRTELSELSMGMSHDFAVAIEEGATIVRIGSALFGRRPAITAI